ncbi:ATP-binding protein [Pannonibacter tanglangensis]|uniref:histidine kinase n=1 Tax=Pannonibacter tanglangensis TaxID=2750084 RepID=A0ABW9ZHY1_9HYPH|nr:ATP-binding protein [Pannonibacter sp. XCT-34]NBN64308.1 two-component sensor histidine kinase [Pannonibacter sp. XCT-34]
MADNTEATDSLSSTAGPTSPLGRLRDLRWVLLVALAAGALAALTYDVPPAAVAGALVLLVGVALITPRRATPVPSIAADEQRNQRRMWPGTGMKVTVDALPMPCFLVDGRGITRYVNAVARTRYAAVRPGDPVSFSLRAPSLLEAFDRVRTHGTAERIEWAEKVPTESWFEASIAPIHLPAANGSAKSGANPDFILVAIRDLTEQRRLERMRTDFVANASHELRTPLASLTGFIETLQGPARDDAVARERFLAIMLDQANRMRRLIDDILSLSRIELRAHVRPDTYVDLAEIVRHTIDALSPLARDMDLDIALEAPAGEILVQGDRDELIQVAENLIENALKYGSTGKRIEVAIEPGRPSGWCLAVRDYGEGIAPEHLPRLTERFYRVDVASSRSMKGTGLGLAIVKHILTRHRARLDIDSKPGEGARFAVTFPDQGAAADRGAGRPAG